jgi:hypothetical protein
MGIRSKGHYTFAKLRHLVLYTEQIIIGQGMRTGAFVFHFNELQIGDNQWRLYSAQSSFFQIVVMIYFFKNRTILTIQFDRIL